MPVWQRLQWSIPKLPNYYTLSGVYNFIAALYTNTVFKFRTIICLDLI